MFNPNNPRIVCLCGSTRFPEAFELLNAHLTMMGDVVISVGLNGHADRPTGAKFLTSDGNESSPAKIALDDLHKRKIDLADCIYVVNVGGYIGSSTKREIEYAAANDKPIYFMFPPPPTGPYGWLVNGKFYTDRVEGDKAYRANFKNGEAPVVIALDRYSHATIVPEVDPDLSPDEADIDELITHDINPPYGITDADIDPMKKLSDANAKADAITRAMGG